MACPLLSICSETMIPRFLPTPVMLPCPSAEGGIVALMTSWIRPACREGPVDPYELLVVLEDRDLAGEIVEGLEAKGCRVRWAAGRDDAVKAMSEQAFDMVLTHSVLSPEQRQDLLQRAKGHNPDVIVILLGVGGGKDRDHDTVSWGTESDVFTPAGLPELWNRVAYYLDRTRFKRTISHSGELIRKFQGRISAISDSLAVPIREELTVIASEMKSLLDGHYGEMDRRASGRLSFVLERVEGLIEEVESLSKGFLPDKRAPRE